MMDFSLKEDKKIVIFCPGIDGHRQLYVYVLADWFLRNGYFVILALGRSEEGKMASETPVLGALATNKNVVVIDLGDVAGYARKKGSWVSELKEIETKFQPEWTFFPDGDGIRKSLDGVRKATFLKKGAKRAALFIANGYAYPRSFYGLGLIKKAEGWLRWRFNKIKENFYFRYEVWDSLGLNAILTPDMFFHKEINHPRIYYIPDIYRAPEIIMDKTSEQFEKLAISFKEFLSRHPQKDIVLYFGKYVYRRGYDILLKLAAEDSSLVFVSCGRHGVNQGYSYDVGKLLSALRGDDRIFEIELPFTNNNSFFNFLYESTNFVLLPYKDPYRPSGILVQAASYGKPVLVPSVGYMAYVVNKYQLGLTYTLDNYDDFVIKFNMLRADYSKYSDNALKFSRLFDRDKVDSALSKVILNK